MKKLHLLSLLFVTNLLWGQSKTQALCSFTSEFSTTVLQKSSVQMCAKSANPIVCGIAAGLQNATTESFVKKSVNNACEWSIQKSKNKIKIILRGSKSSLDKLKSTALELQNRFGINFNQN
jgi:hypothetical protein